MVGIRSFPILGWPFLGAMLVLGSVNFGVVYVAFNYRFLTQRFSNGNGYTLADGFEDRHDRLFSPNS